MKLFCIATVLVMSFQQSSHALARSYDEADVEETQTQINGDLQATMEKLTQKLLHQEAKFEETLAQQEEHFEKKFMQQEKQFKEKLDRLEETLTHQQEEIASLKDVVMTKTDDVTYAIQSAVVAENGELKIFMCIRGTMLKTKNCFYILVPHEA